MRTMVRKGCLSLKGVKGEIFESRPCSDFLERQAGRRDVVIFLDGLFLLGIPAVYGTVIRRFSACVEENVLKDDVAAPEAVVAG